MTDKSVSEIAFEIGYEQDEFASKEIARLSNVLSKDNCSLFVDVFENICKKSQECYNKAKEYGDDVLEYGADRLFVPFHRLFFGWSNASAHDFTWKAFVDDMIDSGAVHVEIHNKQDSEYGETDTCIRLFFNSEKNTIGCVEFGFPD